VGSEIALNRKARHDYSIEEQIEAGLVLEGWEVKSLRAGRAQINDAYVVLKRGEAYLINAVITPLQTASTHIVAEPSRSRKLLLHARELARLLGKNQEKGYTLIPLKLYWKNRRAKVLVGLGKGKKEYDKRASEKERSWQRQKAQVLRRHTL
jgi:SsrA-binding protein